MIGRLVGYIALQVRSLMIFRCYLYRSSHLTHIGMPLRFAVSGPRTAAGGDVHRSAVRGEPLSHRREEVRPEAVRPGDLVQPADGVALQRRLRTIFGLKVSDLPRPALHRPTFAVLSRAETGFLLFLQYIEGSTAILSQ